MISRTFSCGNVVGQSGNIVWLNMFQSNRMEVVRGTMTPINHFISRLQSNGIHTYIQHTYIYITQNSLSQIAMLNQPTFTCIIYASIDRIPDRELDTVPSLWAHIISLYGLMWPPLHVSCRVFGHSIQCFNFILCDPHHVKALVRCSIRRHNILLT